MRGVIRQWGWGQTWCEGASFNAGKGQTWCEGSSANGDEAKHHAEGHPRTRIGVKHDVWGSIVKEEIDADPVGQRIA